MSGIQHLRYSFFAVLMLVAAVALVSCSKKDVVQDEPVINPSDTAAASAPAEGAPSADTTTMSAGEVGAAASELRTIYFAYDSYALTGEARDALKSNADWLKSNTTARVQIEGHCDERGTVEYNMALGDRRANAVKNYLSKMGVERSRLETISYGEERPSDPGHDEAAWSRNRRAVFVTLSK